MVAADGGLPVEASAPDDSSVTWVRAFSSTGDVTILDAKAVGLPAAGVYVLGRADAPVTDADGTELPLGSGYFLACLDGDGKTRWAKSLAGAAGAVLDDVHFAVADRLRSGLLVSAVWHTAVGGGLSYDAQRLAITSPPTGVRYTTLLEVALEDGKGSAPRNLTSDDGQASFDSSAIGVVQGGPVVFGRLSSGQMTMAEHVVHPGYAAFNDGQRRWFAELAGTGTATMVGAANVYFQRTVMAGTVTGSLTFPDLPTTQAPTGSTSGWLTTGSYELRAVFGTRLLSSTSFDGQPTAVTLSDIEAAPTGSDGAAVVGQFRGNATWRRIESGETIDEASVQVGDGTGREPATVLSSFVDNVMVARAILDGDTPAAKSVAIGGDGRTVLYGGSFSSTVDYGTGPVTSAGDTDGVVAIYDRTLATAKRTFQIGGAGKDSVKGLGVDTDGAAIVVGEITGDATFPGGNHVVTPGGRRGFYVMKLKVD